MSIGPGKILVFTTDDKRPSTTKIRRKPTSPKSKKAPKPEPRLLKAGDGSAKTGVTSKGRKEPHFGRKRPPLQNVVAQVKTAPSLNKHPQLLKSIRVKLRLVLSEKQKTQLDALFAAPKTLAALLRAYPQKLTSPGDASMFLLSNKKALDLYINPDARGRSVDLLRELLLQWSGSPPDSIGIDFDDVSLTPDQKVYLPLAGFRGIEVIEAALLAGQRKGRHFKAPFTLFEEDKHFFVALTLEPRLALAQPIQPVHQKRRDRQPREIQLKPGQPLPYISGMRYQPGEPRQRVLYSKYSGVFSGGLKTMNWAGLSGWGVNGGLPSLGKRSR